MLYLTLPLTGPVQYYAAKDQLINKPSGIYCKTEKCPTRNAVVGMIGAALGIKREEPDKLQQLNDSLDIKYRVIKKGFVSTDFIVARPMHDGEAFLTAGGGRKKGTVIKKKEYLWDYSFDVYIGGKQDLLETIREAFQCPVYAPYYGSRDCIPPVIVCLDGFTDIKEIDYVYDCP